MLNLTKTDFIQYLNCPKSLWLLKRCPEEYPQGEFSLFLKKLIKEGYEVEEYAKRLFPGGVSLPEFGSAQITTEALKGGEKVFFQPTFEAENGLFARVDILKRNDDGSFDVYEIKSSTEVKKDKKHNHLKDVCFQRYTVEQAGYEVAETYIIHLNKEFVREGEINPAELLTEINVTEEVEEIYERTVAEIGEALKLINTADVHKDKCDCCIKTRTNHCDTFRYFNKDIPDFPIYEIGRISQKKILKLVDDGVLDIEHISPDDDLSDKQQLQVRSLQKKAPIINTARIAEELEKIVFPIHFIDYETYAGAVPKIDGTKPHQHMAFQVSIHTLQEDGTLTHFEYLLDRLTFPDEMVGQMKDFTGSAGTFVSWHASFEQMINRGIMERSPQYKDYLVYMNDHMFDLEKIFAEDYVDYRFRGSTSIKKVLPVLIPELSYDKLNIHGGSEALDTWGRMVTDEEFEGDREQVRKDLLEYCKLDTFAMVEIYRVLVKLIK